MYICGFILPAHSFLIPAFVLHLSYKLFLLSMHSSLLYFGKRIALDPTQSSN